MSVYTYVIITNLTLVGPCIVIYFCSKTNQVHNISNSFYFGNNTVHVSGGLSVQNMYSVVSKIKWIWDIMHLVGFTIEKSHNYNFWGATTLSDMLHSNMEVPREGQEIVMLNRTTRKLADLVDERNPNGYCPRVSALWNIRFERRWSLIMWSCGIWYRVVW
jgi:hypothetical protein